ncbi:MAG: hypothetical protein H7Y08_03395 [Rhizobiaceae bacterium]|nr:hypothetical protein [Rhizobiaceae bacterium]
MSEDDLEAEAKAGKPVRPSAEQGDGRTHIGRDTDVLPPAKGDGLLSHFVKRTDSAFGGKTDRSLDGEDVGWAKDELDEDGEPLKP